MRTLSFGPLAEFEAFVLNRCRIVLIKFPEKAITTFLHFLAAKRIFHDSFIYCQCSVFIVVAMYNALGGGELLWFRTWKSIVTIQDTNCWLSMKIMTQHIPKFQYNTANQAAPHHTTPHHTTPRHKTAQHNTPKEQRSQAKHLKRSYHGQVVIDRWYNRSGNCRYHCHSAHTHAHTHRHPLTASQRNKQPRQPAIDRSIHRIDIDRSTNGSSPVMSTR